MVYRKPFFRLPPSRRTILDLDFKTILMHYAPNHDIFYPVGMRSKNRFKKVLAPSEAFEARLSLSRRHSIALAFIQDQVRSIPAELFPSFLALAKMRSFTIYVDGRNVCNRRGNNRSRMSTNRDVIDSMRDDLENPSY